MKVASVNTLKSRRGFTLVELVVVVLIIGIIAAVALPKMTTNTTNAKTNAAKQSLAVVRNAVELYKAETGAYPADAATLSTDLKPYLNGPFPSCPIGNLNATVATGVAAGTVVAGTDGWAYYPTDGLFYINHASGNAY